MGASRAAREGPSAAAVTLPPPLRILSDGPAATSSRPARKYTASRQSRRAAWEEVLIVVSLHFTPQITNEHQPR